MTFVKNLKLTVFSVAVVAVLAALPAYADKANSDQSDETMSESGAAVIFSPVAQTEEKPKNYSKTKERLISIVTERAQIYKGRWEALALRFENISERLASYIYKMDKAGYDVSEAQDLLKKADSKIEEIRDLAKEAFSVIVYEAEESDGTAKDLYRIEREVINQKKEEVNDKFNEAKDALNEVLKSLIRSGKSSVSN